MGDHKAHNTASNRFNLMVLLALALFAAFPFGAVQAQQTSLVSVNRAGTGSGNDGSELLLLEPFGPPRIDFSSSVITPDGRFVVFESAATNLVPGAVTGRQVYLRNLVTGVTTLVSVNRNGTDGGNDASVSPVISADGRYVCFVSLASNLVDRDTNGQSDVFVRDLLTGTTQLVSVNRFGSDSGRGVPRYADGSTQDPPFFNLWPIMSTDGRRIVFLSYADDLVENDTNDAEDLFIRDLSSGKTSCVNVGLDGAPSGNRSSISTTTFFTFDPVISADGRFVAFRSTARLMANDTVCASACNGSNGLDDIYVRDVLENRTILVSLSRAGAGGNSRSSEPDISADGRFVSFRSFATDLVPNDTTVQSDIYVRDLIREETTLVSVNRAGSNGGGHGGNGVNSFFPRISGNGRFVAFSSSATDLAPNKIDALSQDVFVRDLATGTTTLASVNLTGGDRGRPVNITSETRAFSYDGRFLVFVSSAADLFPGDTNGEFDGFVRDLVKGATTPFNLNLAGQVSTDGVARQGRVSADGRVLVFESFASDLSAGDKNGTLDVFARPLFRGNPIDDTPFFVTQHYRDFLGREPDPEGLAFWVNEVESCGGDTACREVKRINVSASFFLSIEAQQTGYLVYKIYKAAFGDLPGKPVPLRREQFIPDTRSIANGVIVGRLDWEQLLENNKKAFGLAFVQRDDFRAAYPTAMSPGDFVARLNANAGGVLDEMEQAALINDLIADDTNAGRARVLRKVAEDADFHRIEFNRAFVLMQYFGYLRRNPDDPPDFDFSGYRFWLTKLDQLGGDFVRAEMIKAFLDSIEYRRRFEIKLL